MVAVLSSGDNTQVKSLDDLFQGASIMGGDIDKLAGKGGLDLNGALEQAGLGAKGVSGGSDVQVSSNVSPSANASSVGADSARIAQTSAASQAR